MGIRFRCPNGHKLNVKSFLAGKKGVCPKCGTSMRIPAASAEAEGEADDVAETEVATVGTAAGAKGANGSAHGVPAGVPVGVAAAAVSTAPAGSAIPFGKPAPPAAPVARAAVAMPAMPAHHPGPLPPAVAASDPIAEAPAATWYVRPPSGGQYGPARGDVMRKWVAEGRVSGDSLVWREGWADWRNASQLFPNLAAANPAAAAAPAVPTTTATRSANRYHAKKKSGSGLAVAALIVLALVCVGLVGVLVYVLTTST
ncbi:MAG TPA: DUF4339 domain-containing protein [Pirellulaceae bacterium]|nr:DUF4339 domain-containing protein [Pirellulaceae bacterium]